MTWAPDQHVEMVGRVAWVVERRKNRLDPLCHNGWSRDARTTNPQRSLWEAILPDTCVGLPAELASVDALLDSPAFLAPLANHFDPRIGRPSVPLDTYLPADDVLEVPLPARL